MAEVTSTKRCDGDADRYRECQKAIKPELEALIGQARYAGWSEDEVAGALMQFAAAHLKNVMVRHAKKAGVKAARRRRL